MTEESKDVKDTNFYLVKEKSVHSTGYEIIQPLDISTISRGVLAIIQEN